MKCATTMTAQPGSISHGTMRPEDLIPAFLSALEALDPARAREVRQCERKLLQQLEEPNEYWGKQAYWLLDELFSILDEYSPEGHYFGSHPGDGSDYGWWPYSD